MKAETLAEDKEEILWQKVVLGAATHKILLDTIIFCNGQHFALRSGDEHRRLCTATLVKLKL